MLLLWTLEGASLVKVASDVLITSKVCSTVIHCERHRTIGAKIVRLTSYSGREYDRELRECWSGC
jgi:hypothetical protein